MKRLMAACGIALMLMLGTGSMAAAPTASGAATSHAVVEPGRTVATPETHGEAESGGHGGGHAVDPGAEELNI